MTQYKADLSINDIIESILSTYDTRYKLQPLSLGEAKTFVKTTVPYYYKVTNACRLI